MFENMLLPSGGTHQGRNTLLAILGEGLLIAVAAFVIPALFVAKLPTPELVTQLIAPPLPPAPPPPPPPPAAALKATPAPNAVKPVPRMFVLPRRPAPTQAPREVPMVAMAPPAINADIPNFNGEVGGVPGGVFGGTVGGTLGGTLGAPPAPVAKAEPPAPAIPAQLRVGGDVQAARLLHQVTPVYPVIARSARITGTVALSATIAPNGSVKDLHVLSGNPMLIGAAMDAVKQWRYRPTYLNGKPVEVLTEVDVRFTLS